MEFNKNVKRRSEIIWNDPNHEKHTDVSIIRFEALTIQQFQQLLDEKFIDPEEQQNESPTVAQFLEWALKFRSYDIRIRFEGYTVSPQRADYRTSIDGIRIDGKVSEETIAAFTKAFQEADSFKASIEGCEAWWD